MSRMTRTHQLAHQALQDWASYWVAFHEGNYYAHVDMDSPRVQTPPRALLPRGVEYSRRTVLAVDRWFANGASKKLKENAIQSYCLGVKISRRQKDNLLNSVAEYLVGT